MSQLHAFVSDIFIVLCFTYSYCIYILSDALAVVVVVVGSFLHCLENFTDVNIP